MPSETRSLAGRKLQRKQSPSKDSLKSSGGIELLRTRVAAAETLLKRAREQARLAKRRRKLAKLLAKRARKGAKQAKANLADARAALARTEASLTKAAGRSTARRKSRKTKATPAALVSASNKSTGPRKRRRISRGTRLAPPPAELGGRKEIAIPLDAGTDPAVNATAESPSSSD